MAPGAALPANETLRVDDELFAAACHWSLRLTSLLNKIPVDQKKQNFCDDEGKGYTLNGNGQLIDPSEKRKSRGQVRREKQTERYDLGTFVPPTTLVDFILRREKSKMKATPCKALNKQKRIMSKNVRGSVNSPSREELLARLHKRIDEMQHESRRKDKPHSEAEKGPRTKNRKIHTPAHKSEPESKSRRQERQSDMQQIGDDFNFNPFCFSNALAEGMRPGKKGNKKKRIAVALKEVEAKRQRIEAATAEGQGEQVALAEAANAALKKIRGERVLGDSKRLKKSQLQLVRKKEKSKESWAGGKYTDLKKQRRKQEKSIQKKHRKEAKRQERTKQAYDEDD